MLGAPRRAVGGRRRLFGGTVDYVLREAPCRVLIATGSQRGGRVRSRRATAGALAPAGRARPRRDRAHASQAGVGGGLGLLLGGMLVAAGVLRLYLATR